MRGQISSESGYVNKRTRMNGCKPFKSFSSILFSKTQVISIEASADNPVSLFKVDSAAADSDALIIIPIRADPP